MASHGAGEGCRQPEGMTQMPIATVNPATGETLTTFDELKLQMLN